MEDSPYSVTEKYCRTPLPRPARLPVLILFLLWGGVIFSPFISFTVNGKVDNSNWAPTYIIGGGALISIIFILLRTMVNFQRLPKSIRDEYSKGKLFGALEKQEACLKKDFELNSNKAILSLDENGVRFSPASFLRASYRLAKEYSKRQRLSTLGGTNDLPMHFLPWSIIDGWEVHTDSDGPDYYTIRLHGRGYICLHRISGPNNEYNLLNTIRSLGQTNVRIFCDL